MADDTTPVASASAPAQLPPQGMLGDAVPVPKPEPQRRAPFLPAGPHLARPALRTQP